MSLLRDYSNQARTYDETRAASPSVLGPLREALAGAPGTAGSPTSAAAPATTRARCATRAGSRS